MKRLGNGWETAATDTLPNNQSCTVPKMCVLGAFFEMHNAP
jgi:hypothetical protein